ncbi:MAG: GDYXXLXY domain-containing protein [Bdellovibrionaceae bacterium]|nr:GDYXXLXY domain-containing protein [Pseudobdellovibrionaceae bacterium]
MNNSKYLIVGILFPILVLLGMVIKHHLNIESGGKVTLKILGYDPRDLLSGHYITYRVDYEIDPAHICRMWNTNESAFICLSGNRKFTTNSKELKGCDLYLKGICKHGRFEAGIERFYIPENLAKDLDMAVRDGQGKINVTIQKNGTGMVTDLLIEDLPFKEWVRKKRDHKESAPQDQE